jgi:dTDP-4-amino-4,6-dideoxygalactose transaminase
MIDIAAPAIGDEEYDRVRQVLESGQLADGPEVRSFEREFAEFCDVTHAVATTNGTTALQAALEALGVGAGDKVLTTPFTFIATANAVQFAGGTPIFADIDPETFALDPAAVESRLQAENGDVAAILPVHLYGLPADMAELRAIADEFDVPLVEDAAQAHGATYDGRRVGSLGDAACFSFYPTKNMTTGEGGIVTTDDEALADRIRRFVDHGRGAEGRHVELGHNFRLSSVAAAMGRVQLQNLPDYNQARRRNAEHYTDALSESHIETPSTPDDRTHVYHQYTIRVDQRDRLADHLDAAGVGTGVYYPRALHEEPVYDDGMRTFPVAERAAREVLSLPVHPALSEQERETVLSEVAAFDE